jgi:hypothetical protein
VRISIVAVLCFVVVGTSHADAAGVFRGRAIDARATIEQNRDKLPIVPDESKVPLAATTVTLELFEGDSAPRQWTATTDAAGRFQVELGLPSIPRGRFVARAQAGSTAVFSPFYLYSQEEQTLHLYPPTEDSKDVYAPPRGPCLKVDFNVQDSVDAPLLHVRVNVRLLNLGDTLYVGQERGGGSREICRIPFPDDANILDTHTPDSTSPGWHRSEDGRWLILDTPIPGILDLERQGARENRGWEVTYTLPGRQTLIQAYPLPIEMETQKFVAFCLHKDMALTSPSLVTGPEPISLPDPLTKERKAFDVAYANRPLPVKETVVLALTVDNLILDQVSQGGLRWVGGFVLVVILAVLCGLAMGRQTTSPELLFGRLSADEILDRIASLDQRFQAGDLKEAEYRKSREALLQLAAAEGIGEADTAASSAGERSGTQPSLSVETRDLLQHIAGIDLGGASDPASISERSHLLEALYKTLSREATAGAQRKETQSGTIG